MVIGILNIIMGIIFLPGVIVIQGAFFISLLGVMYIISGVRIIMRKSVTKMLLYFGIPMNILTTWTFMMMRCSKEVPAYYRISFAELIIALGLFWGIFLLDIFKYNAIKRK